MKHLHHGYAALFALSLACGCQAQSQPTSVRDEPAPGPTLTAEQQARRKAYIENHIATRLALLNASEDKIRAVLEQCRSAIHARAIEDGAGRSPVWLIDAPASQRARRPLDTVGASVADIDERWNRFAKLPDRKLLRGELDLGWAVGFGDAGSGAPERVARYECEVDRHLAVSVK